MKYKTQSIFLLTALIVVIITTGCSMNTVGGSYAPFDSNRAYEDVKYQVDLGPRVPGSEAHQKAIEYIVSELKKSEWKVDVQEGNVSGIGIKNIVAKRGNGEPWIIIGSHFDSRMFADQDPVLSNRQKPVPGANDGASSTAILLELARDIPKNPKKEIWLVFFDVEDLMGDKLTSGSQYFVNQLDGKPDSVVVLDMVGDKQLNINMEWNSNPDLNKELWDTAAKSGHTQFIPAYNYSILDDHIPFIKAGINAIDIIDFDYPYWHTTQDTLDKISADSLNAVGDTILRWLEQ